jgi:hypothetical protein
MVEKVFFTLNHIKIKWFANMKTLAKHSLQLVWTLEIFLAHSMHIWYTSQLQIHITPRIEHFVTIFKKAELPSYLSLQT